jgi:hypothetical protein
MTDKNAISSSDLIFSESLESMGKDLLIAKLSKMIGTYEAYSGIEITSRLN